MLKADVLIISSAKVGGASSFYSHDDKCRKLASVAGLMARDLPTHSEDLFVNVEMNRESPDAPRSSAKSKRQHRQKLALPNLLDYESPCSESHELLDRRRKLAPRCGHQVNCPVAGTKDRETDGDHARHRARHKGEHELPLAFTFPPSNAAIRRQ